IQKIRDTHIPAIFHIEEITQPQGHSTSGSHERYKSPERLEWERSFDCIKKFKEWILENALSSEEELSDIELKAKEFVRDCKNRAWATYQQPIKD
ncbi:thiamine pyrophosphate-dependent enzyme, partial [Flavihumibacter sediminis]|nr:thiamine pyrophosphate-dependent enzyme [Flavihumibacter sediminis]